MSRVEQIQEQIAALDIALKAFDFLKQNPQHPSSHFKKAGQFRSARIGLHS